MRRDKKKIRKDMILYGRNSVEERLKADPLSVMSVSLQEGPGIPKIEGLIARNNIPFERLTQERLSRIKPAKDLQGVVARVRNFAYAPFKDMLFKAKEKNITILFLDRINDPHNLGVIIRTAACFGGMAVVIPEFKACGVNETVLHVASGGENYVPVSLVSNLSSAIIRAKDNGYWIAGAMVGGQAQGLDEISFPFPLGLVLGSEGEGIRYGIDKHLDIRARIPMKGADLSFNVNIACAIFCHEICKQKERAK